MKKARIKQQNNKKEEKKVVSEEFSTKAKVITAIVLVLTLVAFYLLTLKLVKNRTKKDETSNKVEINVRKDNDINYSDIKNIKNTSYYLLIDKADDESNSSYDSQINALKYINNPDEFYYIDLSKDENKKLLSDKEELKDLDKLKVKDTTLVYVLDGKIKESYVGSKKILDKLESLFSSDDDSNSNKASNSNSNKKDDKKEEKKDSKKDSNSNTKKSNSNKNKKK
jgi:hypothetical protein